jgi:hypothetical protein
MSKFIWVGEISSRELIKQKKAKGLIILNATEPKLINHNVLVVSGYDDRFYYPDDVSREMLNFLLPLGEFNIYTNNLKGF